MIAISKYNKQHPLRVFEAFAGYGSQSLAFKYLQEILMDIFAIAHCNNINLMEHIRLKMKYNETRPYLHGYKY